MRQRYEYQVSALSEMTRDADAMRSLSSAPQRIADRTRPNEELLAQVESSLKAVGISLNHWQDSIPQPPRKDPNQDYERVATLLYLEQLTMQQLTAFCHNLITSDPTLQLGSLRIGAARGAQAATWNVELSIEYLIYR